MRVGVVMSMFGGFLAIASSACREAGSPVAPMLDGSSEPSLRTPIPPEEPKEAPAPPPLDTTTTYEQAIAYFKHAKSRASDDDGPDLTDAQLAAPLRHATFIRECGAPDSMKITVKVVVKDGKAVGVSVLTNPVELTVTTCIDRHVRARVWATSPKVDSFTTTY